MRSQFWGAQTGVDGFRELYGWLDQRDVLIVKADRQEAAAIARRPVAVEISQIANAKRGTDA